MGKQYVLAKHFNWNSVSFRRPSLHKPAPAWSIIRSIHFKLDSCLTLCESLLNAAIIEQQQQQRTTTATTTTPSLPDELRTLAEKIVARADSISYELLERQSRPRWYGGAFTKGSRFDTITKDLNLKVSSPMTDAVKNMDAGLPSFDIVKTWTGLVASLSEDTVGIIREDLGQEEHMQPRAEGAVEENVEGGKNTLKVGSRWKPWWQKN